MKTVRTKLKRAYRKVYRVLIGERDLWQQIFNIAVIIAIVGAFISTILSIVLGNTPMAIAAFMITTVFAFFCLIFSIKAKDVIYAAVLFSVVANFLLFPVMFFTSGGIRGGMPLWLLMGIVEKVGMRDYVRVADAGAYTLLLKPVMYRLEDFERYARNKRAGLMDDKTWYIYIFATKKKFQRQGYGRKIMDVALSYADRNGCRICLETNLIDNIPMYEHFGFRQADSTYYQETLAHDVMLFEGRG